MDIVPNELSRRDVLASDSTMLVLQRMVAAREEAADAEMVVRDRLNRYLQAKLGNEYQVPEDIAVLVEDGNLVLSGVPADMEDIFRRAGFQTREPNGPSGVRQFFISVRELDDCLSAEPHQQGEGGGGGHNSPSAVGKVAAPVQTGVQEVLDEVDIDVDALMTNPAFR